ncbi:4Fe-4S binding protein [bacterium]|nr:4Fe-4S binding protein [bacterium]
MLTVRKIVQIDEEKCDGCGLCVPSCAEGAIQIIDGKARVVDDSFCDGLGACLGDCPQGAITIIEREAPAFDEEAVGIHLAGIAKKEALTPAPAPKSRVCGCPGSAMRTFAKEAPRAAFQTQEVPVAVMDSALTTWPVQLMLVPPVAPFRKNADILITADCVPFALPDFHQRFLIGRVVLVGCPKLDDIQHYREKLEAIFSEAEPKSVMVLRMEVPCCTGIAMIAKEALDAVGKDIRFDSKVIGIQGDIREDPNL